MTRHLAFIYPLFFAFLIISNSCKKSNETYPEVVITNPISGSEYSYGDTIKVTAKITKSDGNYVLSIGNGVQNLGLTSTRISISGDIHSFEMYYDRKDVSAGGYEIKLTAYNGENHRSDYQDVFLQETPLQYQGLIVLGGNSNNAKLIKIDDQNNAMETTLNGDYSFLKYNAFQGRAVVAPKSEGELKGYSFSSFSEVYTVDHNVVPGEPLYTALVDSDQRVYSLAENGEVRAYGLGGETQRFFTTASDRLPVSGFYGDDGLILCVKERGKENYLLQLLNSNGAVLKEKTISGKAVAIINPSSGLFVAAIRKAGQTVLANYRPATNTFTEAFTLQGDPLCMLSPPQGPCYISTTQQVYVFSPESGVIPTPAFSFSAADMDYDLFSGYMFMVGGNKVYRCAIGGGANTVYQSAYSLQQVQVVLNK